jgi:hypothetical protein
LSTVNFNTLKPPGIGSSYYTATLDFWLSLLILQTISFFLKQTHRQD